MIDYWRQQGILSPENLVNLPITIIGVGGIGSPTTLALSKMGVNNITIYDDDTVENHNIPSQLYQIEDIGKKKTEALYNTCNKFAGITLKCVPEKYDTQPLSGIVISGVDSMAARKLIWDKIRYNISVPLYIEARMGAEVARINSVNPTDPDEVKWYETTLYSDEEALDAPCTARAIIYNVFMIAALIANQVKKSAQKETLYKEIIFDLKTLTLLTQ